MGKIYVAFGERDERSKNEERIGCGVGLKPSGCLCAYLLDPDGKYSSQFERWCEEERFCRGNLRYGIKYRLRPGARVAKIDGWADLHLLMKKYPLLRIANEKGERKVTDVGIDYAAASKDYDCVEFTSKGIANTDMSESHLVDLDEDGILDPERDGCTADRIYKVSACGWEAPCICILNTDVMEAAGFLENRRDYKLEDEELYDEANKELAYGASEKEVGEMLSKYSMDGCIDRIINSVKEDKKKDGRFQRLAGRVRMLQGAKGMEHLPEVEEEESQLISELYDLTVQLETFEEFRKRFANLDDAK